MRPNRLAPPVLLVASILVASCTVTVPGSPAPMGPAAAMGPGSRLEPVAVQNEVRRVLTREYRISGVTGVTCPADVPVVQHLTLFCSATINGTISVVPVTITTRDGHYEVGRPL